MVQPNHFASDLGCHRHPEINLLPEYHKGNDMTGSKEKHGDYGVDYLTVIALSMLAYTLAVLLHEHIGHTLACISLGGHPVELGAFYVNCQYANMADLPIRLVALAGPIVSLITGAICLFFLDRIPKGSSHMRYWAWLFGTISLMTAAGYLMFSGVTGLGDFGSSRDGALYLARPEWLWRLALAVIGCAGYALVIYLSLGKMDTLIGGGGIPRVAQAQKLALTSYLSGTLMSVIIGLLNPQGIIIVLISAAASTLGGTSGLAWMMQMLDRKKVSSATPLRLERSWFWVSMGFIAAILYAVILGPTLRT
jgi:hypothetical protein